MFFECKNLPYLSLNPFPSPCSFSPDAISTLKRAARRAWAVPAADTLAAILVLEKAKLIPDKDDDNNVASSWLEAIAGGPEGKRWRLMFTSGTDQVRKAVAGGNAERDLPGLGCRRLCV